MASSAARRLSPWLATPLLAAAVLGLAACSPPGQDTSNTPGTTPPVFTGSSGPGHTTSAGNAQTGQAIQSTLHDAGGHVAGTATFSSEGRYVKVTVHAEGLTPGFHGMHIHEVAKCEPNSTPPNGGAEVGNFLSAGGHWDLVAEATPMTGQLPPLFAMQNGTADLSFDTDAFSVDDLLSDGGKAIIVHAGPDNFADIPSRYTEQGGQTGPDKESIATGDAGARVACGVVAK